MATKKAPGRILKPTAAKHAVATVKGAKQGTSGGMSVYFDGARFPVTLYADQWRAIAQLATSGALEAKLDVLGIVDREQRAAKPEEAQPDGFAF